MKHAPSLKLRRTFELQYVRCFEVILLSYYYLLQLYCGLKVEQQYWIRGSCSLSEIFFSDVELAGWGLAGRLGDFLHLILVSPLIRPVNGTARLENNKTLVKM